MFTGISFDSVDFDKYDNLLPTEGSLSCTNYYEKILPQSNCSPIAVRKIVFQDTRSETDTKIQRISFQSNIKLMMSKVSGEVGVTYEWGGKDGGEVNAHASASGSDDKGNTAEVKVEVNKDGSGSATVIVRHDDE